MTTANVEIITGNIARITIAAEITAARNTMNILAYSISPQRELDCTLRQSIFSRLCEAPERGIECRILIARHDPKSPHEAMNNQAAATMQDKGWTVRRHPVRPVMHTKQIIIDDATLIAGSHNLTSAALEHNRELSVIIRNELAIRHAREWHEILWQASTPNG